MRRIDAGALTLAALAGASLWISWGVLAVTGDRAVRLGMLPTPWLALVAAILAVGAAWYFRTTTDQSWPLLLTLVLWLPWLPVPVPPSLLIWEGPLEALVWAASLGGLALTRFRSPVRWRWVGEPRVAPWAAAGLVFLSSIAGFAALRDRLPAGDEPHYLVIAQSVLLDGDFQIENNHLRGDYHAYHPNNIPPDFLRRGVNGQIYSIHAPGVSMLVLPIFAVAGYRGAVILVATLCALAVGLLWRAALLLTGNSGAAWAAILALSFSATFFFHTFVIFPDPIGAVIVAGVLTVLATCEISPSRVRPWHIGATGLALGLLPWLHTRFALLAAVAGVCVLLRCWSYTDRWQRVAAFTAGPVICGAAWFSYFWTIYGTVNPTAPYSGSRQNSIAWMTNGAIGLLFDQQFGLISNAPVLVLVPIGLVLMSRTRRRLVVELVAVVFPYFAAVSSFAMWWGGWSAPARFLMPVLPLAVPALAQVWRDGGATLRSAYIALSAIGVADVLARTFGARGSLLYNVRDGHDLLLDWASRTVNLPLAMPAVHRPPFEATLLLTGLWLGIGTLAVITLMAVGRRRALRPGALWATTIGIGIVASATATSASWRAAHADALTPESSKLHLLQRWNPGMQPLAITLPAFRRLSPGDAIDDIRVHTSKRLTAAVADRAMFTLSQVPAGQYRVIIEGAGSLAGHLTASVGATLQPIESWSLDGKTPVTSDMLIGLPVQVDSLVIRGDAPATSRITNLALAPVRFEATAPRIAASAIRASRYGSARSFLVDDRIYMEPGGLWTAGNTSAKLILTADDESATVDVDMHAGPVAAAVDLNARDWSTRIAIAAGEHRRVSLPTHALISVTTRGAFRPIDHEPGTNDRRQLGVRIEFP